MRPEFRYKMSGSPGRTRTCSLVVNSHPLYLLSYRGPIRHVLYPPPRVPQTPASPRPLTPTVPGSGPGSLAPGPAPERRPPPGLFPYSWPRGRGLRSIPLPGDGGCSLHRWGLAGPPGGREPPPVTGSARGDLVAARWLARWARRAGPGRDEPVGEGRYPAGNYSGRASRRLPPLETRTDRSVSSPQRSALAVPSWTGLPSADVRLVQRKV